MPPLTHQQLAEFLEEKYLLYNTKSFINNDPVSIPHLFTKKEDIEIAGFLAATIAWGQRKSILNNANKLMLLLDNSPFDFIMNANAKEYASFKKFVHRTFNGDDCIFFLKSLKNIYKKHGGLEKCFDADKNADVKGKIITMRNMFFSIQHLPRVQKHISNPAKNAAAKRINMYLRWMVRKDKQGVDFGIWKSIQTKDLICPLDVHSGNVARKLGILTRTQNDWEAAQQLTDALKLFDANDPVKYDFALFGLGVNEKF